MLGLGKSDLDKGLEAFAQQNWKRARRYLEEAAAQEPQPTSDYHLGLLYWRGLGGARDVSGAVACFHRAAEEGHVAAQTAFALALRSGVGVRQDADEARKLFRAAAGGDDVEAMLQLAEMSGQEEARRWLERAAEMGSPEAMRALSDLLVARDPVEALAWLYASSALSVDDDLRRRTAAMARELSADEIARAQRIGRAYVRGLNQRRRKR